VVTGSDHALVASLRAGDSVAFGRVHASHGPRLYNFLARMTGNKELALDLYQETWIKLAIHAPRLEPDTELGAWLYTVARNLARSERRSQRARPALAAESATEDARDGSASPHDWAVANETEGLVERALADLPGPMREVLLLVVIDGLEPEQAAVIVDLKPEALRQRLSRARAKLAERLSELTKESRATVKRSSHAER
jgi:RNA polymerase sigma factor (sigma-70 family)